MYNSKEIAGRIKFMVKQRGRSLGEVLATCELGINTVSNISKGKDILTLNFARIADCLDCSVDYLLGRVETIETASGTDSHSAESTEESNLLAMFRSLPKEQREDIFDIVFLKYRKHLGRKSDTYSSFPENNIESA